MVRIGWMDGGAGVVEAEPVEGGFTVTPADAVVLFADDVVEALLAADGSVYLADFEQTLTPQADGRIFLPVGVEGEGWHLEEKDAA